MAPALPALDLKAVKFTLLKSGAALEGFECGEREIDRKIARCCEWHTQYRARTVVATVDGVDRAYGFYTLSLLGRNRSDSLFPNKDEEDRQFIPFIYIDYLAVHKDFQSQGLGTGLLVDALLQCEKVAETVGLYGVSLNAISDRVAGLYNRYNFEPYGDRAHYQAMVLPIRFLFDICKVCGPPQRDA